MRAFLGSEVELWDFPRFLSGTSQFNLRPQQVPNIFRNALSSLRKAESGVNSGYYKGALFSPLLVRHSWSKGVSDGGRKMRTLRNSLSWEKTTVPYAVIPVNIV